MFRVRIPENPRKSVNVPATIVISIKGKGVRSRKINEGRRLTLDTMAHHVIAPVGSNVLHTVHFQRVHKFRR